jgi:hypothetical protein
MALAVPASSAAKGGPDIQDHGFGGDVSEVTRCAAVH